jgi:hypothetical protein
MGHVQLHQQVHWLRGCRTCSSSSASITSCTSRYVCCRQRRIWCSSSARPRSVSCLDRELEARAWEKKSLWTALAQARLASCSTCTYPSALTKAAKPSSQVMMAPSQLSSSLSKARSYSCSSTTTTCGGDKALRQLTSKS